MVIVALVIGCLLAVLLGAFHHFALLALVNWAPPASRRKHAPSIFVFCGLFTIHMLEIGVFALVYAAFLAVGSFGSFGGAYDGTWLDLVAFSTMASTTFGFSEITPHGPLRLIVTLESLIGFMLLTWSATVVFSTSERAWHPKNPSEMSHPTDK